MTRSVLFVQSSPDKLLKKEVQRIVKEHGLKVRVVEKGGRPLQSFLQRSDVDPQLDCLDSECPLCLTSPEGLCRMESVGYRIWCMPCEEQGINVVMDGETGRTAKKRCKEHLDAMRSVRQSSNLREHCKAGHDGVFVPFGCKVVACYPGDPLSRQIQEAVRIDCQQGTSLNDQSEFTRPAGIRMTAQRM